MGFIIITERDYDWIDDVFLFQKHFLGTSLNSTECKIVNREVLEFIKPPGIRLKAKSSIPLEIMNDALGYNIFFDLKEFILTDDNEVNYYGNIRYEELTPKDQSEKFKWEERREETYNGSFRHFLISLCKSELHKNGFYTYTVDYPDWNDLRRRDFLNPNLSEE